MSALRVAVLGSSVAHMVVGEAVPAPPWPVVLEERLRDRGHDATVVNHSRWFRLVTDVWDHFEATRNLHPQVVVVHVGYLEAQAPALPLVLARHLTAWRRSSRGSARLYHRVAAPALWRLLRRWQRLAHRVLPGHRLPPGRFRRELDRLVEVIGETVGATVVLVGIDPPGPRIEHWLPGIAARVERYDRLIAEVADTHPNALHVPTAEEVQADPTLLPDGIHRSARGHEHLAERILAELDHAGVLTTPPGGGRP